MTREPTIFAEWNGWTVVDSSEDVPPGRYEVRDPAGRPCGIREDLDMAIRHMGELATAKSPVYRAMKAK